MTTDSPAPPPVPQPRSGPGWWTAFFLSTGVFVCGTLFGAMLALVIIRGAAPYRFDAPEFRADRLASWLSDELELSSEQQSKIREILRAQDQKFAQIRLETEPRVREVLDQTRDLVKAELTEEQRALWDERFERMRKRMRAPGWDKPGPGSRGQWDPSKMIQRHDKNSDGKLSLPEASSMWERLTPERFQRLDVNADGAWDLSELTAIRNKTQNPVDPDAVALADPVE